MTGVNGANAAAPPTKPIFQPFTGLPALPAICKLQRRPQWVAWQYELKPGGSRWTKPPINALTGRGASHSDQATWSPYECAADHARRRGLPGIGYVLADDDDIGGIDLDDCRDPSTGVLAPWASEILAFGETYAEISPSGRGIRFFTQGKPDAAAKCDPAGVEIYAKQRFLTVTGHHVPGTPTEIRPAPRTFAALTARIAAVNAQIAQEKEKIRQAAQVQAGADHSGPDYRRSGKIIDAFPKSPFFKNVNDCAFEDLASWVPTLFGSAATPSSLGYRISSRGLGRQLEEDLSITRDGAVDFGVADMGDARKGKRSAIDLVIEHGGASGAVEAAMWLCDQLNVRPEALGWEGAADREELSAAPADMGAEGRQAQPAKTISHQGLLVSMYRDRLDIALSLDTAAQFPTASLPPLMRDMVMALVDHVQAPESLCAHSVLGAVTLVTQGLADIALPSMAKTMPLSLFMLAIAASGERKSSCDSMALQGVAKFEAALQEPYDNDMQRYRADKAAFDGEVSKIKADRKIDREERQSKLRALVEPKEPAAPILRAEEPNLEGLLNLLVRGRPSVGVFTAEGGSFLGGHGMSEDAKTRTLTGLSRLYDAGSAQRVRAKELTFIRGCRVSISIAVQAKIASTLLGDELAQDQGFLGRFLVCYPGSTIGTRKVRLATSDGDLRVKAFVDRTERLLELQDTAQAPLLLPTLQLDSLAWQVWKAFAQSIEDQLGRGGTWWPIRATAQRMAENIARLAGVLHLFCNGQTGQPIQGEIMAAACDVGGFYLREALRTAGGVMVDAQTQATNDLVTWLEARSADLISPSIMQQTSPRPRMNAKTTRERIRALCEAGVLELQGPGEIDGKPYREVYRFIRGGKH